MYVPVSAMFVRTRLYTVDKYNDSKSVRVSLSFSLVCLLSVHMHVSVNVSEHLNTLHETRYLCEIYI